MTRFIESAVDVCSVNGWNGTKCVVFRVIYQYTYNRNIYQRYASSRCCRLTSTLMKFEQFDIHRIMMGCDVCWLFGCVKDDARVHWPGTAEQRVFCCVGDPF
jgi:hypothetical protein